MSETTLEEISATEKLAENTTILTDESSLKDTDTTPMEIEKGT